MNEELRNLRAAIKKETDFCVDNERAMKKLHEKFRILDGKVYELKSKQKYKKKEKIIPQRIVRRIDIFIYFNRSQRKTLKKWRIKSKS